MPECCRAGQFPVWGHLLSERPRTRLEWRLLPFVASDGIRLPLANECRSKSGKQKQRARLPRQGLRFGGRGQDEIHRESVALAGLRSLLVWEWSSHFPRSMSL